MRTSSKVVCGATEWRKETGGKKNVVRKPPETREQEAD